jgi:two-component system LytT family response regulator
MKILIIEDENLAAKRLITLLHKIQPNAEILATLDSVKRAVAWLKDHPEPDLLFFDIQLADGLSFEILEQVNVSAPIIFTTAFDEYAIQAFKVNSIDYLLKPIDPQELENALKKYHERTSIVPTTSVSIDVMALKSAMMQLSKQYKERFLVKIGEHIRTIEVSDAAYFYSQEKATYVQTLEKNRYIIDYTLEQVEQLVNPTQYFRINRKYLVSMAAIKDIVSYTNSRLRLTLVHAEEDDAIVSREKVQEFKEWLDR